MPFGDQRRDAVEERLADDEPAAARRPRRILERADQLGRADRAHEAAAVTEDPADVAERGARDLDDDVAGDRRRHLAAQVEDLGGGRAVDADLEVVLPAALEEERQREHVRREHRGAEQRPHTTTSTVTSSQATTHSVHATTLAVMPRVTASASGLGAPPLATTSLAMPQP